MRADTPPVTPGSTQTAPNSSLSSLGSTAKHQVRRQAAIDIILESCLTEMRSPQRHSSCVGADATSALVDRSAVGCRAETTMISRLSRRSLVLRPRRHLRATFPARPCIESDRVVRSQLTPEENWRVRPSLEINFRRTIAAAIPPGPSHRRKSASSVVASALQTIEPSRAS